MQEDEQKGLRNREANFGAGKILTGEIKSALGKQQLMPETLAENELSFVRRSLDNGWVYFIANRTDHRIERSEISFGRQQGMPVLLDPMTGKSGLAWISRSASTYFFVPALSPGQSIFLRVFDENYCKTNHIHETSFKYFDIENPDYKWSDGQPVSIGGDWKIKFLEGGPVLPADFSTAQLASWTTFPDTNCQAFAGTAKYETTFAAPKSGSKNYFLDLGDVRQSARVKLNGKDYGTLITPPFRVVVDNLQPAGNVLEVEVTSVAANRIRDLDRRGVKWKTFRDINIVDLGYKPFDASNWPLTDCGLLGPVTLTPVTAE
jgi:hypothetical protein